MRARVLVVLLLGLLIPVLRPGTAVALDCPGGDFGMLATCWTQSSDDKKPIEAVIGETIGLGKPTADQIKKLHQRTFEVTVRDNVETGPGGTLALVLADRVRVADSSRISPLDPQAIDQLLSPKLCGKICKQVSGTHVIMGKDLEEPQGDSWLSGTKLVVLAVIVLGAAGIGYLVLTRRSPAPATAGHPPLRESPTAVPHRAVLYHGAPPPTGRPRRATVRTDLHPQGYVEIDRSLYRAAWAQPDLPAPGRGRPVDVFQGTGPDSEILLAYPPGTEM